MLFRSLTEYLPYFTTIWGLKIYYTLILYVISQGFFASTMVLLWNIGSAYFGHDHQADIYQSTHLFLTGVRAIFAPLAGIFIYQQFGYTITFGIGIIALLLAIVLMQWSYRQQKVR